MPRSGTQTDEPALYVCDASVWINLVATQHLEAVIAAMPGRLGITLVALGELEEGRSNGHATVDHVSSLLARNEIEALDLIDEDQELFFSLVSGDCSQTIDDGEAATLVCAHRLGATAVIDERKATGLARDQFPNLPVRSTTDLLLSDRTKALSKGKAGTLLYNALVGARMRVPHARLEEVADLVGQDRLRHCRSLPESLRERRTQSRTATPQ